MNCIKALFLLTQCLTSKMMFHCELLGVNATQNKYK